MKKRVVFILAFVLLIAIVWFSVEKVEKEIDESMQVESFYQEGYWAGHEDYLNSLSYHDTIPEDFDKLLYQYKLAFDSGYGYGFWDASNGTNEHEDCGSDYYSIYSPNWMRRIYYLFKP